MTKKQHTSEYKGLSYKQVFCIREKGRWVAGIYHSGRTIKPVEDKKKELALAKLCNNLYEMGETNRASGKKPPKKNANYLNTVTLGNSAEESIKLTL